MALDLSKYLQFKPLIDADVKTAQAEVVVQQGIRDAALLAYDAAVTRLNNLAVVQKLLNGLTTTSVPTA